MKSILVNYVICPECGKDLTLKSKTTKKDEVIDGKLTCPKGHKFNIIRGIPRFVVDKTDGFVKTEDAFSSKWKKFNKSYHDKKWFLYQRNWFLDRFGWKNTQNLNKFLKTRTKILDAGTGIGNSAKLFSSNPDAQVFAIDASMSIEFAYKKYGATSNIHFIQADLRSFPSKNNFLILSAQTKSYITQKIPKHRSNI
ncbi:hypothetical protein QVH35_02460 [Candidatus Nitrosotenuis chungbukensis]|nr:methyltransferase domain-containing protein [Candidatus Nitrosotenuis chungbukensis]WKT58335.1 hypothetical protein QVH35_02460 [Candidatus Nitrosotenuis chungbukensis]